MKLKDRVKIECMKKGVFLAEVARNIGYTRNNLYYHLKNGNVEVANKVGVYLGLGENYFS